MGKLFRPAALIISLQLRDGAAMDSTVKLSTSGSGLKLTGLWVTGADFGTGIEVAKVKTPPKNKLPPLHVSFIDQASTPEIPLYNSKNFHPQMMKDCINFASYRRETGKVGVPRHRVRIEQLVRPMDFVRQRSFAIRIIFVSSVKSTIFLLVFILFFIHVISVAFIYL